MFLVVQGAKRKTAVILTRFTPQLGEKGEVIYVSPGYFRNFLLPTKQALLATPEKLADIRRRQEEEVAFPYNPRNTIPPKTMFFAPFLQVHC